MRRLTCTVFVLLGAILFLHEIHAQEPVDFNTQIAPIFTRYCMGCHNDDDLEGEFSLASYDALMKGAPNGPAVLAEDPDNSLLIRLITATDETRMPPKEEQAPTPDEVALLKLWIEQGAKGPQGQEPDRLTIRVPAITSHTSRSPVTSLDWSNDLLAVARYGEVKISQVVLSDQVENGVQSLEWKEVQRIADFPGKVTAVHFYNDSQRIVTASGVTGLGGIVTLWDWQQGTRLRDFKGHKDIILDAEVSPQGDILATSSYDKKIILWNIETGEQLHSLNEHNGAVYDICFSPDGTLLASASADDTCKIWRVSDGDRLDTLGQPLKEQYTISFSPDGKFVAAGGADNRIRVWQVLSTEKARVNPLVYARFAHEGPVLKLAYSSDGSKLVSVAEDRTVKVWETKQYTELKLIKDSVDISMALAIDPTGEAFVLGRMDGSLDYQKLDVKSVPRESIHKSEVATPVVAGTSMNDVAETEPNTTPEQAQQVPVPAKITGVIHTEGTPDQDCFKFSALQGQEWVMEVNASRSKSPLDSYVEILHEDGTPVERLQLQAVRDSYFTFRGKDANQAGDFRIFNWEEMELNDYLFANGEVVKLWLYPRGPDSGFDVYPGTGNRFTFFDTTPIAHALGEPCYIVKPFAPEQELIPNGLPVFKLYYNNDDESMRQFGNDSKVHFTAPEDSNFVVRIKDVRSYQGSDFKYTLNIRPREPDFSVKLTDKKLTVFIGSAQEMRFTVNRLDDYQGPIAIELSGLPPGFQSTSPIIIEAGQREAMGVISCNATAKTLDPETLKNIKIMASATIRDQVVSHAVGAFEELKVEEKPKVVITIVPAESGVQPIANEPGKPAEYVIHPGETIMLKLKVERNEFDGEVSLGKEDSGRNTPHGVYVDNIGLNGLLLLQGQNEREFFITATKIVTEQSRLFHLKTDAAGGHVSLPILLHVQPKE